MLADQFYPGKRVVQYKGESRGRHGYIFSAYLPGIWEVVFDGTSQPVEVDPAHFRAETKEEAHQVFEVGG